MLQLYKFVILTKEDSSQIAHQTEILRSSEWQNKHRKKHKIMLQLYKFIILTKEESSQIAHQTEILCSLEWKINTEKSIK